MKTKYSIRTSTAPFYALLLLTLVGLNGCKKSQDARPAETPITSFLSSTSAVQTGTRVSGPWELGIVFSSAAAGKITQVGSKMPEAGTYRVIIWDFDTKTVLRQKTIEQSTPDKLALDSVDPLALTPDKKYVISINTQSSGVSRKYGYSYKTGGADFMPFTRGSILVQNACYSLVATPTFPSQTQNIKYEFYGFPEFTFVAD